MSITLQPEIEALLKDEAERRGQEVDALANTLIRAGLGKAPQNAAFANAHEDHLSPEERAASRDSVRRAFADLEAGRTVKAQEVFAKTRAKLGL